MALEATVRNALRADLLQRYPRACQVVDEFWVPQSHERADLAVLGESMDGYEIKTERDTLRRLPRQAAAYGRLFDRCTVVVAEKHAGEATATLPDWWGITTIFVNGKVTFNDVRAPQPNPDVDAATLVRLLWRDEAAAALVRLGHHPEPRSSRGALWRQLLDGVPLPHLRDLVRRALVARDPAQARIATRRFTAEPAAAAVGL